MATALMRITKAHLILIASLAIPFHVDFARRNPRQRGITHVFRITGIKPMSSNTASIAAS
jgi:hypothetical protein